MSAQEAQPSLPVAIVGIAAEFPGGASHNHNLSYKSFAQFLLDGQEAYGRIPADRFNIESIRGHATGQVLTDTGAFLKEIDLFDYLEFGITGKDARLMPVGTRKLVELAFLSLLDSGIDYRGQNVGCYMSGSAQDIFSVSGHNDSEARGSFAYAPAMVANRVSYHLDLRGPSIPLDTACSSTLTATHVAVQALRNGECDAAVVGGCQINHRFSEWLLYTQGGILSPDGKCKPFDASADGFGRGEGGAVIVLKPLPAALRDNDRVYGVILGTGINSSGSLAPVNAPVALAQQDAMVRAFAQAQRSPKEVDFIELHATGTAQGDPTEANWIGSQFKRDGELLIGSVKGNIGHTEITAFLASLCKVCSIFETGVIPPNVNFKVPNPAIKWKEYAFRVPVQPELITCRSSTRRPLIAMTSSGIGGANGHCIVEGPPSIAPTPSRFWVQSDARSSTPSLLIAAGLSPRSASTVGEALKSKFDTSTETWQSLSRALGRRSRSMTWRSYAVARDGQISRFSEPSLAPKTAAPLVFVFSGQGPQHWNMGRELFKTCAPFRTTVLDLDQVHISATGKSLISDLGLFGETPIADALGAVWPIAVTLPALTVLQIALVDALAELGVKPDVVLGHSAGETAVLYGSGAGGKALAVELAIARGKAMSLLESENGTMAALACSPEQARQIITEVAGEIGRADLEVGCYNTPEAVTLSGLAPHIDKAVTCAKAKGMFATRLRTRIPVHSAMMEICREEYQRLATEVFSRYSVVKPTVEVFSTLTGECFDGIFDAQYFWDNTRGPVMFTSAMQAVAAKYPNSMFLELGPHPVLTSYIAAIAGNSSSVICPLRRAKSTEVDVEILEFMGALGKLTVAGHRCVDFDILCGTSCPVDDPVLSFPFSKREVPYAASTFEITRQRQHRNGPLNYPQLQVNTKTHPCLAEHIIKDEPIMPAAGYIEMALEFGAKRLYDVEFHSILALSSERPAPVDIKLEGSHWSVRSASAMDFAQTWPPQVTILSVIIRYRLSQRFQYNRIHASGHLSMSAEVDFDSSPLRLDEIRARLRIFDMKGFYDGFTSFAQYGPTYQRIISWGRGYDHLGREEVLVQLRGADDDLPDIDDFIFHPAVLDSALHILVHPALTGNRDETQYYLPSKVGSFAVHDALQRKPFPRMIYTHATFVKWSPERLVYDFTVTDENGIRLCTIHELEIALHGHTLRTLKGRFELVHQQADFCVARPEHTQLPTPNGSVGTHDKRLLPNVTRLDKSTFAIEYKRGFEIDLQKLITSLDSMTPVALWFISSEGLDGDASLGFTRSLRREYLSWLVRSVVFDNTWTGDERIQVIGTLMSEDRCEDEISVRSDGSIFVPRIVEAAAPPTSSVFNPDKPWKYEQSMLKQISLPDVPDDHVLVRVTGFISSAGRLWAFIGHVDGVSNLVAGITSGDLTTAVVAHIGSVVHLSSLDTKFVPDLLACVIAGLAVGPASFMQPHRLKKTQIIVTHSDMELGSRIVEIFQQLGLQVSALSSRALVPEVKHALSNDSSLVVVGSSASSETHIADTFLRSKSSRIFVWHDSTCGVERTLEDDPWAVGDVLRFALSKCLEPSVPVVPPLQLVDDPLSAEVPNASNLFDSAKSYLLIGGIGSLGLQIALWMYKNGARDIVLTSRSGLESLIKKGEFVSQRLLAYLQMLPGLTLRTEAVDALSIDAMRSLLDTLVKPLGGCMFLTAILIDRTFAMQTEETFEASVACKVDAFRTLEEIVDIDSLDFVIATSSVCGLFGNAGQTNYACGNTGLTGLTRRYRKAMTVVSPFIIDTGLHVSISTSDMLYWTRFKHLHSWGMTGTELCEYLGDALRKLQEGNTWQYIPAFDWNVVRKNLGPSPLYDHLTAEDQAEDVSGTDASADSIKDIICRMLDISPEDLSREVPLTTYGLDSLSAAALSHALRPILIVSQIQLLADLTLANLEDQLADTHDDDTSAGDGSGKDDAIVKAKGQEMVRMVEKYTAGLRALEVRYDQRQDAAATPPVVLITGTTGSLGAHMLARFVRESKFEKIYVLIRKGTDSDSVVDRQRMAFVSRGLDVSLLLSKRVSVIEGDLDASSFGLSAELQKRISTSVTHIVHLAWPINFGLQLSTFESAIHGLRLLIEFAATFQTRVKFVFASTAGVFRRLEVADRAEEIEIEDPVVAIGAGYSESKWVGERLLSAAAQRRIIDLTIVRVGQLSGGINGAWRIAEWVPSLISTSLALGCLPDGQSNISWLPVDYAAATMIDFMASSQPVLHLRHPRGVSWTELMEHFGAALKLPLVTYSDWFTRLDHGLLSTYDDNRVQLLEPGLRLLEFFRLPFDINDPKPDIMVKLVRDTAIDKGLAASPALRDTSLLGLGRQDVDKWLKYWRSVGFLPRC
ncbi:uncharacterized protein FIBRA_07463 [Fibroporia radiculosa]|uniref:Carrier domain-containing protein n=1 Tax=Fibroporia radiculosa TaxID=599839 RepID=J4GEI7_9APHY|nr:uncharacterized protein FIBRA_07463 [Fibroporia radiculosa]CCM05253.1 predicted protein [Fibroporia radiculosa]